MANNEKVINILNDMNKAIDVMRKAATWLLESGKNPSKWWRLENLNSKFLLQYAKSSEFYVLLIDKKPAAAAIFQTNQNSQDWQSIDKNNHKHALYIHWLCVDPVFSGKGLPKLMVEFAKTKAKENNIGLLRVDTNANEIKLRQIYEKLGFSLVAIEKEDYRETAFYEKKV